MGTDTKPESKPMLGKLGTMLKKFGDEIKAFYEEVVVTNGPRYRDWRNYGDLWIDLWNSFFGMHYLLGHVVGIGLPLWGIYEVVKWAGAIS